MGSSAFGLEVCLQLDCPEFCVSEFQVHCISPKDIHTTFQNLPFAAKKGVCTIRGEYKYQNETHPFLLGEMYLYLSVFGPPLFRLRSTAHIFSNPLRFIISET